MKKLLFILLLFCSFQVFGQIEGFWRFNGNLTNSVSGTNATGSGTIIYKASLNNSGVEFAKNSWANCGNIANYTSSDFTISFLMYIKAYSITDVNSLVLFTKGNGPYNSFGFYCDVTKDGIGFNTAKSGSTQSSSTRGTNTIDLNKWYYITIVRTGASVRIFQNGVDKTVSAGTHQNPAATAQSFYINVYNSTSPYYSGNVLFDDFKISPKKWNNAEIKNEFARLKGFF